jgi:hypothetical protein
LAPHIVIARVITQRRQYRPHTAGSTRPHAILVQLERHIGQHAARYLLQFQVWHRPVRGGHGCYYGLDGSRRARKDAAGFKIRQDAQRAAAFLLHARVCRVCSQRRKQHFKSASSSRIGATLVTFVNILAQHPAAVRLHSRVGRV